MGTRHISCLTLGTATSEQVGAIVEALRALPDEIPELRAYDVGVDLGLDDGNATIVVVGDFDDVAGYEVYRDHPAHRKVAVDQILPVLTGRSAIQYER